MPRKQTHSSQHSAGRHRRAPASQGADGASSHGTAWRIGVLVAPLESDGASFKGVVKALPTREDIQVPVNEQLIVEYYSK